MEITPETNYSDPASVIMVAELNEKVIVRPDGRISLQLIDEVNVAGISPPQLETLLNKQMPSGSHEVEFTAKNLPSGIYLYRISAGEFQQVNKMVLLK